MGQTVSSPAVPSKPAAPAKCPIEHDKPAAAPEPAKCPVDHGKKKDEAPAKCPVDHDGAAINPNNQMPDLSQNPAPQQTIDLPTSRTESSIPRGDNEGNWEYPSPQQFYNALVRKGWETPEEHIETMVHIHNFLNEEAWEEVKKWERRRPDSGDDIQLTRLRGRPGELSPKARFWMLAGWLLPSRFNTEPPFDRHDWVIRRPKTGEEVRYVIDYYSAPPEPDGSPVFSLDVRPALDSLGSVKDRICVATEEVWADFRKKNQSGGGNDNRS
ncbi:cytochrome c heme lyase [Coprinopsis cinerea okayama7|uniref:Holocytochrome c-type synthase n=1 Tax=Coprinopsis cinerea (strain Okayama-7 / 130 / ATCC MYA-4618 / FGSC 9003) TaxID=240176 RepID=A8N8Y5_COPC7|nr:cytochrome c heme lyase [Coprinopsis cinerea okayama7\|eukprot:XP_001831313.1 cytochrome c heme lyase [Coprinopsis cinerea okayama7\